jgi:hypothetical protein
MELHIGGVRSAKIAWNPSSIRFLLERVLHLKDKHAVEEEISRKAMRLEVQKGNIEQAVDTTQRIQKQKAVGLTGPPGGGGASSQEWNEDVHKALLVSVSSGSFVSSSASGI